MDPEAEVIKEQMEETREDLAKKLERLETQVAGAVENVTGTVEAVSHTVEQVKEAVADTVDTVKESVTGTVESVKETVRETFDLPEHVRRHPWLGFGGSFIAGFVAGRLVHPLLPQGLGSSFFPRGRRQAEEGAPSLSTLAATSREADKHNGRRAEAAAPDRPVAAGPEERLPGWLESLAGTFSPELAKLKGLAIGTVLGLVRDQVARAVPPEMASRLTEVINDFTAKMGGEVLHGPVLGTSEQGEAQPAERQPSRPDWRPQPSSTSGPAW
jgi:ElaB/YqjD/DUF883 family membrane-anchored ribosome-binding protein